MSDLVERLLAAIAEAEEAAEQYPEDHSDPDGVLRLCQAHREIIDMYRQEEARSGKRDKGRFRDLDHASAMGRLTALGLVVQALAGGYDMKGNLT